MAAERSWWAHARARASAVRVRVTAASVIVVGIALIAGAVALTVVLRNSLVDNVRESAQLRAEDFAEVIEQGTPAPDLTLEAEDDLFVQVLDADGDVVAASPNLDRRSPVATIRPGQSARVDAPSVGDGEFLVVADRPDQPAVTVLVGRSLESVGETTSDVRAVLVIGVPLLLLIVGATCGSSPEEHCVRSRPSARASPRSRRGSCTGGCPTRPATTRWPGWRAR